MLFGTGRVPAIASIIAGCILLYWLFLAPARPLSCTDGGSTSGSSGMNLLTSGRNSNRFQYYNMDSLNATSAGSRANEHVLILTPFKEAAHHIERYFDNINRLTYPHNLISLGFLVSDSKDGTVEKLQQHARWFQAHRQEPWQQFHRISIFQKDFSYDLPNTEERHAFNVQVERRKIMAKSRNTLLSAALTEEISWVLWLDGDVVEYPATLLEELIALDKDVIAPNCWWHSYNEEGGYDRNNWQETPESREFQKTLQPEDVLVEGM